MQYNVKFECLKNFTIIGWLWIQYNPIFTTIFKLSHAYGEFYEKVFTTKQFQLTTISRYSTLRIFEIFSFSQLN